MNQPAEDRFKRLEEEQRHLREEVRQLREQITEPIKITRLEIDSGNIHKQLDAVQEDTNVLKIEMAGARADILQIRESQADQRDTLKEHGQHLEAIRTQQERNTETLGNLLNFAESHEKSMATKDDVARIEKTQAEQGDLLKLILDELRKPRGE
jgi:hypothetical protein